MKETWCPINNYEGLYEVSDTGLIRSIRRKGAPGGLRKISLDKDGYRFVNISKGNHTRNPRIARLVALAFLENPLNLEQVNHIDGNKLNDHVDNLEWCTRAQNVKHAYDTGLRTSWGGFKDLNTKLTSEQVRMIRNWNGSLTLLATQLKVSRGHIYGIRSGRRRPLT